jgi:SAM-dependent methyltransferase
LSAAEPSGLVCLNCGGRRAELWARAHDVEYLTTPAEFSYWHCLDCNSLFIDPLPADRLREIYPLNYYAFQERPTLAGRVKKRLDQRLFSRFLANVTKEELAALDVGGGSGWVLTALRESDPRVRYTQVVDLDEHARDTAMAQGHNFHLGRVEEFTPTRSFDVVLMLNLIEHVANPREVLRKTHDLLSPEGLAFIKTPNYQSLDAALFRHRDWAGYHCPRHWVIYSKESFEEAVRAAGLEVVGFSFTQGAPFWTFSTLCWLAGRGLVRVTAQRPVVYHPLYPPLSIAFAAFDFARGLLWRTSQMVFVVRRKGASGNETAR